MKFIGMAASHSIWALSANDWSLAVFALVFGVFYGGWVAVLPAVVMDYFGGRNVSGIIGELYTSVAFGTLIGPSAAGFAFDLSHSYELPIVASAASNVLAALIVALTLRAAPGRTGSVTRPCFDTTMRAPASKRLLGHPGDRS